VKKPKVGKLKNTFADSYKHLNLTRKPTAKKPKVGKLTNT